MFGFKAFTAILAAATAFVSAAPSPASGAGLVKREANASPAAYALPHVERAAEALQVRDSPTTIPDCVSKCQDTISPIFVQIDAAIDAKATIDVFVSLWAQVVVALKDLVVDLTALVGASVDILAGLTVSACATLIANLCLSIAVKLQACVAIFAVVDLKAFLSVFVDICAAIVAVVDIIVKLVVGINVFLDVDLVACVNILVTLCLTLGASVDVIASIKALIAL